MTKTYSQIADLEHPVIGLSDEYPQGYLDTRHDHQHAQLLFAVSGVMQVMTDQATYTVPPQRALLIPARTSHEVRCRGAVSLRTLYFDWIAELPEECLLIDVSEFLRSLILEIVKQTEKSAFGSRELAIWGLLKADLALMPTAPYRLPMPSDARLQRVCKKLLSVPSDQRSLDEWVLTAAMGRRSFTRLFKEQTGMSFDIWKREARIMEAVSLLNSGMSVTQAALEVGYENVSAFTARFRQMMGMPPTAFLKHRLVPSDPENRK